MKAKWAVLGSGGIALRRTIPEGIIPAENAELVAVYDANATVNREVAEKYGAAACQSEEEVLSGDCDIVYVATPVDAHHGQAVNAARAGKHVFCEKPLGLGVAQAEGIVSACKDNNVKLGVGFMMRFHAYHQEALRLVKDGYIGTPVLARAQLSCWYPPIEGAWRQNPTTGGGGSLSDMGSHCIDLLEMFFGRAQRVSCLTGRVVHDYESEDTSTVLLDFENGAKGVVDSLFNVPDAASKNRLELYGSKGCVLAEGTVGQGDAGTMTAYFEEGEKDYEAQQERQGKGERTIAPPPVNTYRAEVEAFSQSVLEGTDAPVGGDIGLWSQKVITACYESARTGAVVPVGG